MRSGRKIEAPLAISGVLIFVLALLALVLPALAAPVAEIVIGDASAYPTETTSLPIMINNAENVGVVDLNLGYDPLVVHVITTTDTDFDFEDANINNTMGIVRIGVMQMQNPGRNDTVTIANITLKAVGNPGSISPLNIIVNEFKDATPQGKDINYTRTNGTFSIIHPAVTPTPTPTSSNGGGGGGGGASLPTPSPTPTPTSAPTATPTLTETSTLVPIVTPPAPTSAQTPAPTIPAAQVPVISWSIILIAIFISVIIVLTGYLLMRKRS